MPINSASRGAVVKLTSAKQTAESQYAGPAVASGKRLGPSEKDSVILLSRRAESLRRPGTAYCPAVDV